uniref:UDENN domain-containing protein n=1 Tax=Arcella intermedia TaxID=1963864 RepID=A0A6B2L1D3_9EUKA
MITLFVCLVEERRVIGIGATVSKVTSCVNAIYSLLYPFTWQHVFIPILPTSLMTMVEAPVPYIIGILKEAQSTLFTDHEIEKGTVILDVDSGKWILAPPNQLELPTRISTLLKKHLERLKSSAELRGQSFNQMVTHIFLFIWVELFIGFSKCFTDNQFNTDRFIKSRTPPYRTFTNAVVQTQMFETFIREREELAAQNRLASCVLAQASIPMLKKKLEPLKRQKSSKRAEVKSKSTSNRNRTEEKKENRKSNELLPVMQHTRSVDDMTKSSEQPTSMLQSISDVERTISSEIDCQEDTSMSIAETTELSDPKTSKEESSPQVPPLSTSQPSTSSLPLSTSAVSARLSRGIDEIALQTIKKVVSTTNKRKINFWKVSFYFKRGREISEKSLSSVLKEAALDYCVSNIPAEKNLELYQDEVDYVVETAENGPLGGVEFDSLRAECGGAQLDGVLGPRPRQCALRGRGLLEAPDGPPAGRAGLPRPPRARPRLALPRAARGGRLGPRGGGGRGGGGGAAAVVGGARGGRGEDGWAAGDGG